MGTPVGELVEEYASRHNIRPGMTGLAQVRGFRGPVHDIAHLQGRVESDLEYIEGWKPTLDLWIIVETIKLILSSAMFSKARNKVC
jgi:lipopolysaccharide/colanic/teichoic acid biosynthesis glycosyltransferase